MADVEKLAEPPVQEVPTGQSKDVEERPDAEVKEDEAGDGEAETDAGAECSSNREEYSSERFKLEIRNLPKSFGFGVTPRTMSDVIWQTMHSPFHLLATEEAVGLAEAQVCQAQGSRQQPVRFRNFCGRSGTRRGPQGAQRQQIQRPPARSCGKLNSGSSSYRVWDFRLFVLKVRQTDRRSDRVQAEASGQRQHRC